MNKYLLHHPDGYVEYVEVDGDDIQLSNKHAGPLAKLTSNGNGFDLEFREKNGKSRKLKLDYAEAAWIRDMLRFFSDAVPDVYELKVEGKE